VATLVFANGDELPVTATAAEVLGYVTEAQRSGIANLPSGWIKLKTAGDAAEVSVQVALIAYVRA
jgi:hypothetical protein